MVYQKLVRKLRNFVIQKVPLDFLGALICVDSALELDRRTYFAAFILLAQITITIVISRQFIKIVST